MCVDDGIGRKKFKLILYKDSAFLMAKFFPSIESNWVTRLKENLFLWSVKSLVVKLYVISNRSLRLYNQKFCLLEILPTFNTLPPEGARIIAENRKTFIAVCKNNLKLNTPNAFHTNCGSLTPVDCDNQRNF